MDISKRIRSIREEYGYTLKDLYKLSGVSVSYISEIELGKKNPTYDILEKLANGFGISITKLIGKDEVIINNIKKLIGNMEISQFVKEVNKKTGIDAFDEEDINAYISGDVLPSRASLQVLADYAEIDIDLLYRTVDNFEKKEPNNKMVDKNFIALFEKIKENNLDLKSIENIVDIMIQQAKK